jgi:UDP-GlcNAc:undecaprenyl-phosphate GlcNAc-1-phosphate transferase
MIGAALLTLVGTLDDIFDLHPVIRLGTGLLAALIVVGSGIGIAYVTNPFADSGVIHLDQPQLAVSLFGSPRSIWIVADLFALLFILWNMNIVNWSKGVDGQMPGFVAIAFLFIGLLSERFFDDPSQFNTGMLSFIAAGAFVGFLFWNWHPQKIMPGYGAGSLAGYLLSVLAILSGAKLATAFMVLAIPTADALFTIVRRLLAGKSPLWGDRGHLHHKLLDVFKWTPQQISLFYWCSSLLLGMLSLYLNTTGKLITISVTTVAVFGVLIWAKQISLKRATA